MHAIYYQRKRETPYDDKPLIQNIFLLKANADAKGQAIKTLLVTDEELRALESEIRQLAADVNFYKLKDARQGLASFIGVSFEVIDTISAVKEAKVDKRR